MQPVDVVVVGGGPAGSTLALALARLNFSVVVIERSAYDSRRVGETFPAIINDLFARLAFRDAFAAQGHLLCHGTRSVWGSASPYENESLFNPYGAGWHVDRAALDAWLARLAEEAGVRVMRRTRVVALREDGRRHGWSFVLEGDRRYRLRARVAVDATGRLSWLAKCLGATRTHVDRLVGLIAYLERDADSCDDATLVEATESGWWYSAPLPGNRLIVDYMTDADLAATAPGTRGHWWHRQLRQAPHTNARCGGAVAAVEVVAADISCLKPGAGATWLAIGDAAMTFDPLSSLGVYKAVESGARAAHAIRRLLAGYGAAFDTYHAWTARAFEEHLYLRAVFYSRERRWPRSPFWHRRHVR